VSTPSHGGLWLSPSRVKRIPSELWPSNLPWYEEDCEIALAIVAYPDIFDRSQLASAVMSLFRYADEEAKLFVAANYAALAYTGGSLLLPPDLPPGYTLASIVDLEGRQMGFKSPDGTGFYNEVWTEDGAVVAAWHQYNSLPDTPRG